MFDVDGTLVDAVGFDSRYYAEALRSVLAVGRKVEHDVRFDDFRDRDAVLACLGLAL